MSLDQTSFKPTMRYLGRQLPKWRWVEVGLHDSRVLTDLKARGLAIDNAPMRMGEARLSKRVKAVSRIIVDPWNNRVHFASIHPAVDGDNQTNTWKWSPNDRGGFEDILSQCLEWHQSAKADVLDHMDEVAALARQEALLAEHERRHGALAPLDRLRMRYIE